MNKGSKKAAPPVEERIIQLFKNLGIQRVHIAGQMTADWKDFAASRHESILSLTIICPIGIDTDALGATGAKTLIFSGDEGPRAESVQQGMTNLPEATLVTLKGCQNIPWADVVAEHTDEISAAMMAFLSQIDQKQVDSTPPLREGTGDFAGLSYRISGHGPPLVLLPLGLAPSQWEPILAKLTNAPGNDAPIGGLKVVTENGWFAARPSGTEEIYKIYAESFKGDDHLRQIQEEAQAIVSAAFRAASL